MNVCKLSLDKKVTIHSGMSMEDLLPHFQSDDYILACQNGKLYYYRSYDPFLNSLIFEGELQGLYRYRDKNNNHFTFNKPLYSSVVPNLSTFNRSIYPFANVNISTSSDGTTKTSKINFNTFFKEVKPLQPICIINDGEDKVKFFLPQAKIISETKTLLINTNISQES